MFNKRPNAYATQEKNVKARKGVQLSSPDLIRPQADGDIEMTNFPVLNAPANASDLKR